MGFPGSLPGKASDYNAGDPVLIPGWGRSPGEGIGYPLQYSPLRIPIDRGAWRLQSMQTQQVHTTECLSTAHLFIFFWLHQVLSFNMWYLVHWPGMKPWKFLWVGTSLVVQGLRCCTPNAGGTGSIPSWGRFYMQQGQKRKGKLLRIDLKHSHQIHTQKKTRYVRWWVY